MNMFVSGRRGAACVFSAFALALLAASGPAPAQEPRVFDPGPNPRVMAFRAGSVDELLFVTSDDKGSELVLAAFTAAHRLVAKSMVRGPFQAAVFLDRERILTGDKAGNLVLWSLSGRRLGAFAANGAPVEGLAVSPSGRLVAVRHPRGPIRLYTSGGKPHGTPLKLKVDNPGERDCEEEFGTRGIVFSPDSSLLAASDVCGDLVVADVSGRALKAEPANTGFIGRIAFARDGRTLLASWWGMPGGGANLFTVEGGRVGAPRRVPGRFEHLEPADVAMLGEGFLVATGHRLRFMAADGRRLRPDIDIEGPARIAVADSGDRVAVLAAEGVVLFDGSGKRIADRPFAEFGAPSGAEPSADGRTLVALSAHGSLRFWSRNGDEVRAPVTVWDHDALADWLVWPRLLVSPGRKTLAVVAPDKTVRLFDAHGEPRGAPIRIATAADDDRIEEGAFALHDGRLLVPSRDGLGVAMLSFDGAILAADLARHRRRIKAVAFAPDGARFATYDENGVLRLWSNDGTLLKERRPRLHALYYNRLAFAPGGETLAAYAVPYYADIADGIVLWHLGVGDRVEQRRGRFLRFLDDGALARQAGNWFVVDAPDGAERYVEAQRGGSTVHVVFDDLSAVIASSGGVARLQALQRRR